MKNIKHVVLPISEEKMEPLTIDSIQEKNDNIGVKHVVLPIAEQQMQPLTIDSVKQKIKDSQNSTESKKNSGPTI